MHMAAGGPRSALQTIQMLGLTTGLQLCLDAGDSVSYSGSGQTWSDRSGNGYDFLRGTTSSSQASDPTFNGTAGQLSKNEYWSFDGGDWFTLGQANPTWVNNIHKNNAVFAVAGWAYSTNPATNFDLCGTSAPGVGFFMNFRTSGVLRLAVRDSSEAFLLADTTETIADETWTFFAARVDEATAAGLVQLNGEQETFTSTYSSPSSSNASTTMRIASLGDDPVQPAGSRLAMFNAWEGTIPTAAKLLDFYNLTRGRFGA